MSLRAVNSVNWTSENKNFLTENRSYENQGKTWFFLLNLANFMYSTPGPSALPFK